MNREKAERYFRIGLFGAILTLIGDCLIGAAKFPDGANMIEGYFAIARAMPAWRPILGGLIGFVGICLEFPALMTICPLIQEKMPRGDRKHSPAAIHNYPPDIQEEYFKTHERIDVSYQSKNVILTKGFGVLLFTCILLVCALVAGANSFRQGFWLAFGLMAWIGIYDTCFLDWVLFANLPRFRLEGTEHMDKAYHQKWFHLKGMLFPGVVFALIPATLVGWLVTLI